MIVKNSSIQLQEIDFSNSLDIEGNKEFFKDAIFFDLEHYVYKKPICIGVFGAGYYNEAENCLKITQFMLENKYELKGMLTHSKKYFEYMKFNLNKKCIVTFSGNNDFIVIDYLLKKYKLPFDFDKNFVKIDLQKKYEEVMKKSIGLKVLESEFGIVRESELISGSTLAKTFGKVMKDSEYFNRMPDEKKEKILLYNMQDVVSLFHIYINWNSYIHNESKPIDEEIIE